MDGELLQQAMQLRPVVSNLVVVECLRVRSQHEGCLPSMLPRRLGLGPAMRGQLS